MCVLVRVPHFLADELKKKHEVSWESINHNHHCVNMKNNGLEVVRVSRSHNNFASHIPGE